MSDDQLTLPLEEFGLATDGPAAAALSRSVVAASRAGRLGAKDEGAAVAALHLARALDTAVRGNAPLDAIVRATGALRAWYVALGLTPVGRGGDNGPHEQQNGSPGAWAGFGDSEVRDTPDP